MKELALGLILGVMIGDIAYKVHLWNGLTEGEKIILENLHFLKIPGLKNQNDPILIITGVALLTYFLIVL